jgi:hypothetical protein
MSTLQINSAAGSLGREEQIRAAVLSVFCDPVPEECSRLKRLSGAEWRRLLPWLDTSGLALYFLDRVSELGWCHWLPLSVLARLRENLIDNAERTRSMIAESNAIHLDFQNAKLRYATLKGFSLWPCSVPKLDLRSQLDLDFLTAPECAAEARRILEGRGYRLQAVSGRSWEFKTADVPSRSRKDLYKAVRSRCVELHLDATAQSRSSPLARVEMREFHGTSIPVLCPTDLLLGQGLHLYKHVCSEFLRAAHVVEFRRHVLARRDDSDFWAEVRSIAGEESRTRWALGVATLLVTRSTGEFAPEALSSWTVDRLPASVRLWVELYGCRSALAHFPGSKLYLFLQREVELAGFPAKRPLRQALLPLRLPPSIVPHTANQSLPVRIRCLSLQIHFILFRLRFHASEGCRYFLESFRWRRRIEGLAR